MKTGIGIEGRLELPEEFRYEKVLRKAFYEAGERRVIADLEGPGCVRHFYCAVSRTDNYTGNFIGNRKFVLRIYWDGEKTPSVEVPAADFFGIHHNVGYYPINSYYLSAKANAGLASYFPMPFGVSARFEIEAKEKGLFIYTLDWHKYLADRLDEKLRFHASWRRENPAPAWSDDFLITDAVGKGYLIGFSLGVRLRTDAQRWTHAGSENLYIDGEATGENGVVPHYLRAAGGENSFDVGFGGVMHKPDSSLFAGFPYYKYFDSGSALSRHIVSAYKFFIHDLVPFRKSLHFRWGSQANDMCATAYWYQAEPHRPFVKMAAAPDLQYGDWDDEVEIFRGKYDILKQAGAAGPEAILASPDDGTWSLFRGDEVFNQDPETAESGLERPAFHGFIDFSHVFNVKSKGSNVTWPCNATALTILHSESETPATLHLSWDDHMKIRINGDILDLGEHRGYRYRAVAVNLRKGKNKLSVNLDNPSDRFSWGSFTFSCRAVLPDGRVVVPGAPA